MSEAAPEATLRPLVDDPEEIPDDTTIFRRVLSDWVDWSSGQPRAKSIAFQDYPKDAAARRGLNGFCMSVGRGGRVHDPALMVPDYDPAAGVTWFLAQELRELRNAAGGPIPQGLMPDPTEAEPWHAVVFSLDGRRKTGAMQSAMALLVRGRWAVPPGQPSP